MEADVLDTDAVIDNARIGRFQIIVGFLCALVLFVDGFNTLVIGYIGPQIAKEWSISSQLYGWVVAADKIGLLIGYLFVAPLSGRFGHKKVIVACVLLFGALTFLTTLSAGSGELITTRLITGIGLGGALPSAVALTGEYFPLAWRSSSITFIYCGLSLGQLSGGSVADALLQTQGWRAVLLVGGGLSFLLAGLLAVILPDSLEFLINRGQRPAQAARILRRLAPQRDIPGSARLTAGERGTGKVKVSQLLQSGRALGTVAIWLGLGMNLMVNTSLQTWLTKMLIDAGFTQHTAILATQMSMVAGLVAAFIIGPLMDRFGPYIVMTALFVGGALFSALLGFALSWSAVVMIGATSFGSGFCTSGVQKGANALAVYFYPTALRSTGLGWTLGIGRIGAILGPSVIGQLLAARWSDAAVFYATALPMLIGATALFAMGRFYGGGRAAEAQPLAAE